MPHSACGSDHQRHRPHGSCRRLRRCPAASVGRISIAKFVFRAFGDPGSSGERGSWCLLPKREGCRFRFRRGSPSQVSARRAAEKTTAEKQVQLAVTEQRVEMLQDPEVGSPACTLGTGSACQAARVYAQSRC